jgi:hypothetical protein
LKEKHIKFIKNRKSMDYILDYFNDLSNTNNGKENYLFSSLHNIQVQDPLSKLINWLNTERGAGIKIKSEEDLLIEDFLSKNKSKIIQLNLDDKKNIPKEKISIFNSNRRNPDFPTGQQKAILAELKKVPVYTVVNGNNEIILASPRQEISQSSVQWLCNQYYNWFIWKEDQGPVTIGLFFSNKEDAESYLHEVCLRDPRGAQNLGLSVKSTGLDTFYYLNRTSSPNVQVRMISNLKELDLLITKNIKKRLCFVNPKQKYGQNWFKGTPIYILRTDNISNKEEKITKKLIFFSNKDVEKALEVLKNSEKKLNIKKTTIEIYNLENYLLDLEKSSNNSIQKVNFFPPYPSYEKNNDNIEDFKIELLENKKIKKIINEKVKSFQRFCKGVIWLVTSDTLPSEENSW